jgi:Family of unknown function (DUF6644)
MSLDDLQNWIDQTALSATVKNVTWVIPIVQSVHILAISVVIASVLLMNLRTLGLLGYVESAKVFFDRYLPRFWISLGVLLVSGVLLIIGEPQRTMHNPIFYTKMTLLLLSIGAVLLLKRQAGLSSAGGEARSSLSARILAWGSFTFWIAIIFCGRWIAYAYDASV